MLPDNRIRYPAPEIDFESDVGTTSQAHDTYPAPDTQARYDHMRMTIIGLLSQQSSYNEPSEYRDGTPWFDLNTMQLKIRTNNRWAPYAEVIELAENFTLLNWYELVSDGLSLLTPELIFSGNCTSNNVNTIPIPEELREHLHNDSRAFIYKNGLLLDVRHSQIIGGIIILNEETLDFDDKYTVVIKRVQSNFLYQQDVIIP